MYKEVGSHGGSPQRGGVRWGGSPKRWGPMGGQPTKKWGPTGAAHKEVGSHGGSPQTRSSAAHERAMCSLVVCSHV